MGMTVIAVAAVAVAGASIYSAATAPKPPEIPPPPPPAGYISYDEDGNPAGEQVWNAEKNAYEYKPAPLTEAQKAEKAQRDTLRTKMLSNLDQAPADRIKAYEDYAKNFSDAAHKNTDQRYADIVRSTEESLNARGMTGSRAYADITARLAGEKMAEDTDIATRAKLASEDLANTDRNYYMNVLNNLDAGRNSDTLNALNKANTAYQGAQGGTASLMGGWAQDSSNRLNKWNTEMAANQAFTQNMTNTASGLAFLYGYGGGGKTAKSPIAPGGTSINRAGGGNRFA